MILISLGFLEWNLNNSEALRAYVLQYPDISGVVWPRCSRSRRPEAPRPSVQMATTCAASSYGTQDDSISPADSRMQKHFTSVRQCSSSPPNLRPLLGKAHSQVEQFSSPAKHMDAVVLY